jgi:hypothetical protein
MTKRWENRMKTREVRKRNNQKNGEGEKEKTKTTMQCRIRKWNRLREKYGMEQNKGMYEQ